MQTYPLIVAGNHRQDNTEERWLFYRMRQMVLSVVLKAKAIPVIIPISNPDLQKNSSR